ncbi:MAG TPA: dipeptidyl aminopeptidase [Lentisphaeria bacterium]|nr:MAG: hypothetical protein A2X45_21165 [Lentisphaerae bacterium GWF2_50_93]HCE42049.1 dipeptidyl aminopeptidase [Lentisphaeria bacterium]
MIEFSRKIFSVPEQYQASGFEYPGVKALFYEGMPYNGRRTRIFAWYGVPDNVKGKVPAMMLVHGGGGTAFPDWVRLWNSRGYAALAMDTCGGVPAWFNSVYCRNPWPRHDHSGPLGWGFDKSSFSPELPPEEQWPYHAVSSVVLGHSLLRSFPEVDPARIGITGISWGGYLTCMAAGVDKRFAFAAPVYGCGFLGGASVGLANEYRTVKDNKRFERWLSMWDPSHYLPNAKMPVLWVNGTNDFAFPMDSMQDSYRLTKKRFLAVRVRMPHAHGGAGENPEEILLMADHVCKGGESPSSFKSQGMKQGAAWAKYKSPRPVKNAELNFTRALGHWTDRTWNTVPAVMNDGLVSATLPKGTTVYYFNIFDECGRVASSEHVCLGG